MCFFAVSLTEFKVCNSTEAFYLSVGNPFLFVQFLYPSSENSYYNICAINHNKENFKYKSLHKNG